MRELFSRREKQVYDLDTMNLYLSYCDGMKLIHQKTKYEKLTSSLTLVNYVYDSQTEFRLTTKQVDGKPCTYKFSKSGKILPSISNGNIYMTFSRYYKVRDVVKEMPELFNSYEQFEKGRLVRKIANSAKPLCNFRERFKEGYVYCYDINSAYSRVLYDKIIDTDSMVLNDKDYSIKLKENQVGFLLDRDLTMYSKVGQSPDVIFNLIDSPYKKFIDKYYDMKKNATTEEEKLNAKAMLNICIGQLQNHNPFLRAYVVNSCNDYIKYFLEKYKDCIISWNTDGIKSTKKIKEIEDNIGTELGQWKLEYHGNYRQLGSKAYQKVDTNEVVWSGCRNIKALEETKNFNILKDDAKHIKANEKYVFNEDKMKIEVKRI